MSQDSYSIETNKYQSELVLGIRVGKWEVGRVIDKKLLYSTKQPVLMKCLIGNGYTAYQSTQLVEIPRYV